MRVTKQPGESWLVMLRQGGGQLDISEKDDAVFDSDEGLIIYHNDQGRTVTFAPKEGIGFIRAYTAKGGGSFSRDRVDQGVIPPLPYRPSTDLPSVSVGSRELGAGEEATGGDGGIVDAPSNHPSIYPCPDCHHANIVHERDGCVVCHCELAEEQIGELVGELWRDDGEE